MSDKRKTVCFLCGEVLPTPTETFIVNRHQVPVNLDEDLAQLPGQCVCKNEVRELRDAGFKVFNLQEHRDHRQVAARTTLGDRLRAKGQTLTIGENEAIVAKTAETSAA